MILDMFNQNNSKENSRDTSYGEEELLAMEAFSGDSAIIIAAQELNQLRETCN